MKKLETLAKVPPEWRVESCRLADTDLDTVVAGNRYNNSS